MPAISIHILCDWHLPPHFSYCMLTAPQDAAHTRLCIINKNNPGVLGEITTLLGSHGVNIAQQLNTSREGIAYNVIDMQVWYGYREK